MYFGDSLLLKLRQIFLRNDTADENQDVVHPFLAQQLNDTRAESVVRTTQDRNADGVDVFLKRSRSDHLRCLTQAGINHFHTGIAQGTCDDFGSSVMAIKPGLCDKNSNLSTGHRCGLKSGFFVNSVDVSEC